MEANEEKRERYLEEIKEIPREKLVYIDEAGIDMNICKDRGWAKKGEILQGKKSGKHYERTNILLKLEELLLQSSSFRANRL